MKNLFKKTLLAITAILLCGMLYVTGSSVSLAATDAESAQETGENAELTGAASVSDTLLQGECIIQVILFILNHRKEYLLII